MKKRILSIFCVLALCLSLLPATAWAGDTDEDGVVTYNWSCPCDQVNQPTLDLYEIMDLPDDVTITSGISIETPSLLSGVTPTYSPEIKLATIKFTTRTYDEPTSGTLVVTVNTSDGVERTVRINITLTGKYIVQISASPLNAMYDGEAHAGYSNLKGVLTSGEAYTGDYTYSYETADGTQLDGAPTAVGSYRVTIAVPEDNETYRGSVTLAFQIIETSDAEATYQTSEDGAWVSGTFAQALEGVYDGGTIQVLKNVVLTTSAAAANKSMTITSFNSSEPAVITSNTERHGYLLNIKGDVTLTDIIVDGGSESDVTASRALIAVQSGTLTLGEGAVVRNNNNTTTNGAGGGVCVISGGLTIDGGVITNNCAYYGGGVAIVSSDTNVVLMERGEISYNTATSTSYGAGGGGVYQATGSFTMRGGSIEQNTVNSSSTSYGSGGGILLYGTASVEGGTISGNEAPYGSGVFAYEATELDITDVSITGNTASIYYGAVLVGPGVKLNLAGSPVIAGNICTGQAGKDLYLDGYISDKLNFPVVTVAELGEGADIGVYTWLQTNAYNGDFKMADPAAGSSAVSAETLSRFTYEDNGYVLAIDDNGQLVLRSAQAALNSAKEIVESANYTVSQATANTETAVKTWLAGELNRLLAESGISVEESNISISDFKAAQAGTAESEAGTDGGFSFAVSLEQGEKTVSAQKQGAITAEPYIKSSNADLSEIRLSDGTLSPAFDAEILNYTLSVGYGVSSITVTPIPTDAGATVSVNGGSDEEKIPLAVGETVVSIRVVAEDGISTKDYTLTITRASASGGGVTTYAITVPSDVDGGTVTVSPKNAAKGLTVTVTTVPDEGYELASLVVTDASGNRQVLKAKGEGVFTFKMPDSSATVAAVFRPDYAHCDGTAACPMRDFTDTEPTAWYHDGVHYCISNGLMDGTSATTFEPNANMTRAMVWTILARIDGETVTGADWQSVARAWAIAKGVSDGTDANGLVTREQFATMLYRYAVAQGYDVSIGESTNILSYADYDEISEWAIPAMQWACGSGAITGVTDTTLVPQGTATRAQAAAMLMRFVENVK